MPLAVSHRIADLTAIKSPLRVIPVAKGSLPPRLTALDRACDGALARCWATGDFTGAKDESTLIYPGGSGPERILLVGLGEAEKVTVAILRRAAMVAGKCAWTIKAVPGRARSGSCRRRRQRSQRRVPGNHSPRECRSARGIIRT